MTLPEIHDAERRRQLARLIRAATLTLAAPLPGLARAVTPDEATASSGPYPIELPRECSLDALARLDLPRHLVSEKLDGVRAIWTGARWQTRSGRPIDAPPGWRAALPAGVPLDGELWAGRGRFEVLSGLLHRADAAGDPLWSTLRYAVFDLPGASGPYAVRQARLQDLLDGRSTDGVRLEALPQRRCADVATLRRWFDEVVAGGGEGLVLHAADALFQPGRSSGHLLKLKPLSDAEAEVIGHLPGKGRHTGRLGALVVRDDAGRRFAIGSGLSDAQRESPPPVGACITYRFRGLTRHGLPRFATFWRVTGMG